ncbi:hypothetical protein CEXT_595411 [Caerostris extrusa]|uniref:Uncharacterized protein n=1 Tax=Caerostris extrusa TaxID=172846 RepID=A0AAV4XZL4_CAEEX|nr:hypothetical protein CEXT_595411 [Caerostris extrusa]
MFGSPDNVNVCPMGKKSVTETEQMKKKKDSFVVYGKTSTDKNSQRGSLSCPRKEGWLLIEGGEEWAGDHLKTLAIRAPLCLFRSHNVASPTRGSIYSCGRLQVALWTGHRLGSKERQYLQENIRVPR